MNQTDPVLKMCALLTKYTYATKANDQETARNTAFEMLGVLNGMYNTAYVAAAAQARKGKAG